MTEEVIMAGFGGQGVMVIGQLLTYSGMKVGKNVSWIPSYGPEMRGGTANCAVVVSDEEVASPVVAEPTTVIAMNRPSLEKFEPKLRPGGLLIYNSSLIDTRPMRTDITVMPVPANEIAQELGNLRIANMVILGAYIAKSGVVPMESVKECLKKVISARHHDLIPLNEEALDRGAGLVG